MRVARNGQRMSRHAARENSGREPATPGLSGPVLRMEARQSLVIQMGDATGAASLSSTGRAFTFARVEILPVKLPLPQAAEANTMLASLATPRILLTAESRKRTRQAGVAASAATNQGDAL